MNPKDQIHYDIAELLEKIAHLNIKLAGTNKIHPVEIDLLRSYLRELEKLTDAMPVMPLARPSFSIPTTQDESSTLPSFNTPEETITKSAAENTIIEQKELVDKPEPLVVAVDAEEPEPFDAIEPYTEPEENETANIAEPVVAEEEVNTFAWEQPELDAEEDVALSEEYLEASNNKEEDEEAEATIEPTPVEEIVLEAPVVEIIYTELTIESLPEVEVVADQPAEEAPSEVEVRPSILSFFDAPVFEEPNQPVEAVQEEVIVDKEETAPETTDTPEANPETAPLVAETPIANETKTAEPEGKRSINDMFSREGKEDLGSRFLFQNRKNLREMIDLSERYVFTKELFGGDADYYDKAIRQLNQFEAFADAESYMNNELYNKYNWAGKDTVQQQFARIVARRFA
jgi:hypothetical protein